MPKKPSDPKELDEFDSPFHKKLVLKYILEPDYPIYKNILLTAHRNGKKEFFAKTEADAFPEIQNLHKHIGMLRKLELLGDPLYDHMLRPQGYEVYPLTEQGKELAKLLDEEEKSK